MKVLLGVIVALFFFGAHVFAATIILEENPEEPLEAPSVEVSDREIKAVYPLTAVKSINGIPDMDRIKLTTLAEQAHHYIDAEEYGKGYELLEKVIGLDPDNPCIVRDMARALQGLERYPASTPYALKEIAIDPRDGDAYRRLGNAYRHDRAKEKEAVAAYQKAIELQGPNPVNQFDMGVTYEIYERCGQALPYLERAITMEPESKEIRNYFYQHLGRCYLSSCQYQKAIAAFQKVLEKFPEREQGKAYYWLSVAYEFTGEHAKAAEHERRAEQIWKKYGLE